MACTWNSNHLSCTNTWGSLLTLKELKKKFSESGTLTMPQLAFWPTVASADARLKAAKAIASSIDGLLMSPLVGAKREPGVTRPQAIEAMAQTLTGSAKTVCELSMTVDDLYLFQGEIK